MQIQTSASARKQYQADGFYIHPTPIIPREVVDAAVVGMDEVRAGRYETGTPPQPSSWNPGDDPNALGKIEMPQLANRAIHRLVSHPALGELVAEVTGAQQMVQVWWVQLLYKPSLDPAAGVTTNVGLHQDRQYWGAWDEGSDLFTAWVALSDVTEDAGPMQFVRGSHHWGLLGQGDFWGQDNDALRQSIDAPDEAEWEDVAAILPPGGVSLHHCLTFHGSGPNTSGAPRRSFAIHMRTENSRPKDGVRDGLARFIDNPAYCPVIWGELTSIA